MVEENSIKVSVIIPCLNVSGSIRQTLNSVVKQTLDSIEIICVDAGSSDGTIEIIKEYAEKHSNLNLLASDKKSYGYQVNLGIKNARGEYIAIVEDDFVEPDMYECLYFRAEENKVDFVKSNYYYTKTMGGQQYSLLAKEFPIPYDTVVTGAELKNWHLEDFSIWNGIYNREFLLENNILLNETPGAAYQDIGFVNMVLSCSEKGVYMRRPLYHYNINTSKSSSSSINCLKFLHQEFSRLLEGNMLPPEKLNEHQKGILQRLSSAFVAEADKILPKINYDLHSDFFEKYFKWIQKTLNNAFEKNIISTADFEIGFYMRLSFLLRYPEEYISWLKNENNVKKFLQKKSKISKLCGKDVILIGWGHVSKNFYYKLYEANIPVIAIIDNNSLLWGSMESSTPIIPLYKIKEFESESIVVLAIKNKDARKYYADELKRYGILENNIMTVEEFL